MLEDLREETRPIKSDGVDGVPLRAIVAIPVCNEAERITACLDALDRQRGLPLGGLGLVMFLNNCTDGVDKIVAAWAQAYRRPVRVIERTWAGAHAGWARREAMEAAARWFEEQGANDGVILTTDADSCAPADWVVRNLATIDAGADAVAGRIALDPVESARLPDALHARGRLEGAYEALLAEIAAAIDPDICDPWPTHWTESGATFAVRLSVYRRVGGLPAVEVGEDKAFAARLRAHGARLRHAVNITVTTSGRLDGRAPGGAADTMRLRCAAPESPCDQRLERLSRALFRYGCKRWLRRLHARGRLNRTGLWAPLLLIPKRQAVAISRLASAGEVVAVVERASPRLAFHPLTPRELPPQIKRAERVVRMLRGNAQAFRALREAAGRARSAASGSMAVARRMASSEAISEIVTEGNPVGSDSSR